MEVVACHKVFSMHKYVQSCICMRVRTYLHCTFTLQAAAPVLVFLQIDTAAAGAAGVEAPWGPHIFSSEMLSA